MPFILRNIRLQGVDSVHLSNVRRVAAWKRLAQLLSTESLNSIVQKAKLADIPELARRMIAGEARGRTVITLDGPP
jgi:acrylyl-CoA reductase (NADPH)